MRERKSIYGEVATISNLLTLSRIFLSPFIFWGIMKGSWYIVFILLLIAALTDVLDGHLARALSQGTTFGACLDPVADKLLLISSFAALSFVDSPSFFVPPWFFFLILSREIIILGGSLILLLLGIKIKVAPSLAGKLTTFFQLSFIVWIFACYFFGWNPVKTYSVSLILLAFFSLFSLVQYGIIGFRYLSSK
jgi:cardiolipin synthase (CMP-forming)